MTMLEGQKKQSAERWSGVSIKSRVIRMLELQARGYLKQLIKTVPPLLTAIVCVLAQNPQSTEERAEELRRQLRSVIDQEAELQTRLQQIEADLKPENIQRSIALVGTTRPEDLREQRRQQLEKDKASVQAQLEQLATSRTRLEASIATAEAEADRQRMQANTPPPPTPTPLTGTGDTAPQPAVIPARRKSARPGKRPRRPKTRRRSRSD